MAFNNDEILKYLLDSGTISLSDVAEKMEMERKERIVKKYHPYAITESKDGRYRTYIQEGKRRQIVRTKREALIDFLVDFYSEKHDLKEESDVTLAELYDDWLKNKGLHVERTTIIRIKTDYRRYYENSDIVNVPLKMLTSLQLDEWVHKMIRDHKMNKHQYANFSLILRQMLDYAVERTIISANPFDRVKVDTKRILQREYKKPDKTQVYLEDERNKLFEHAMNEFETDVYKIHKLIPIAVMFMFDTGVRVGEVIGIRYEDVGKNSVTIKRMVRFDGEVVNSTKGVFGERSVPLIPHARELIEIARKKQEETGINTPYIFSMTSDPTPYEGTRKAFYKYCKKIGIVPKSSHKARKTFVSSLIDQGVNINSIRQFVGHVDERTTFNNYCFDRSDEDETISKMTSALSES